MLTETLHALLARRDEHAALVDPTSGAVVSHAQLLTEIEAVAGRLAGMGVGPGHRVAISMVNGPDLVVTFLAIVALGAAVAPLNPALSEREKQAEIDDLAVSLVVQAPPAGPDGTLPATVSMSDDPDSVALLLHTSGTTSRPKTVPLRQRNLSHSARTVAQTYALGPNDVSYCVMPLFHIHGLVAATLAQLSVGGTVVIPPKFSASRFWDDVTTFGATWYTAVPSIHHVVLATCRDGRAPNHGLRFVRSCSSTLPPPLWRRFESAVGVPLVEAYGMTEAAHQMASNPLPPGEHRPGSVGVATGVQVAVMDSDWQSVAAGDSGEVCVRGPSVVAGYLDNPEANQASFRDGWFRTGDVGTLSADGYLTLVGRIKELINRGGEKISPYEVEAVLLEHPAVSEAAAYPVPDEKYGEQVAAVVVASAAVTPEELRAHCTERIVAFKVPAVIHLRTEIPKGPTGKIQRRLLATLVAP